MIKCQYCELSYPTQPKLDDHVKAKHETIFQNIDQKSYEKLP